MTPQSLFQELGWFIIRLVGLLITIYAAYQLFALAYINYTFEENFSNLKEVFPQSQIAENKNKLVFLALVVSLAQLGLGVYCLRGGSFIHQLLFYRGREKSHGLTLEDLAQQEAQQPSEGRAQKYEGEAKELFKIFLAAHPQVNKLNAKDKHQAFREWLKANPKDSFSSER